MIPKNIVCNIGPYDSKSSGKLTIISNILNEIQEIK
jgi:hypothetical protein